MPEYLTRTLSVSRSEQFSENVAQGKEEQIMPKDKYSSIFWREMESIVLIILQIFFATRADLKIGEYPWILFVGNIPSRETRYVRTSENI